MCMVSNTYDQYRPYIPQPSPVWPPPNSTPLPFTIPNQTIPAQPRVAEGVENDWLKRLIGSLRQALEAAEEFDKLTGQPDCEDPEKAQLMEKVDELEQRLATLEKAGEE